MAKVGRTVILEVVGGYAFFLWVKPRRWWWRWVGRRCTTRKIVVRAFLGSSSTRRRPSLSCLFFFYYLFFSFIFIYVFSPTIRIRSPRGRPKLAARIKKRIIVRNGATGALVSQLNLRACIRILYIIK